MCRSRIDSRAQESTDIKVFRCSQVAGRHTFVDLPRAIMSFPRRQTYRLRVRCRSRIDSRAQKSTCIKVFRCSQVAGRYMPRKGAKMQPLLRPRGRVISPMQRRDRRGRVGHGRLHRGGGVWHLKGVEMGERIGRGEVKREPKGLCRHLAPMVSASHRDMALRLGDPSTSGTLVGEQ